VSRIRKDELPGDQVAIGDTLTRVGNSESGISHFQQAVDYYRQALDVYRHALGENDTRVAAAMMGMGGNLWELNQLAEAEQYQLNAVEINSKLKGRHDLTTMDMLNDLALTYDRQGKLVEEEALFREILDTEQQQLRPDIHNWRTHGQTWGGRFRS
jgi:tetratricopeptide (TPR) repeat protein